MPVWNNLSLSDANSPIMEQMMFFHDHSMSILIAITILVLYMSISTMINNIINKSLLEGQDLESIWTSIPAILLIMIAFPSLQILYMMEESPSPSLNLKIIAHQWYWSYQYSDLKNLSFDSFMLPSSFNSFRLLDVDLRLIIPFQSCTRLLITSNDVIHAWTIPTLGIKTDATPGRLNQLSISPLRPGLFFGQCSEICGAKHSFMPICLEIIPPHAFLNWLN